MARDRTTALNPVQLARRVEIGEERRARTRARLMEAAYRLFATHGADAPTIDDVIAEAGVARGTFYNHFRTREELFRGVANDIAEAVNQTIFAAIDGIADPAHRLALAFRMFVRFAVADEPRGWILLRTMPLVGPLNARMKAFIHGEFARALESGRMRAPSLQAAVDLGIGLQITTIHRLLTERGGERIIDEAAEMLLLALGMDGAEARTFATMPLPKPEAEKRN